MNTGTNIQGMALEREDGIQRYALSGMGLDERAAFERQLRSDTQLAEDLAITQEAIHCLRRLSDRRTALAQWAGAWEEIDQQAEDEFLSEPDAQ